MKIPFGKIIGSIARHASTAIGTYLIAKGVDQGVALEIAGVALAFGSLITSFLEKKEPANTPNQ